MNSGEVHHSKTYLPDRIDDVVKKDTTAELPSVADATTQSDLEIQKPEDTLAETTSDERRESDQALIEELKELIIQEFDQLRNGIERYQWMQRDIEAHIRNMLHIVHAEHTRESQVERLVAQVAKDIAAETIGEDIQGTISQRGYSSKFLAEVDQLSKVYRARETQIVGALEQSKTDELSGKRDAFINELVRKPLEHVRSAMYSTDAELIRLLQQQKRAIRESLEMFQQLQYFQTEEVWQNPAYRLLQEYSDKAIQVIDTQLQNLRAQTESDKKQIDGLARESLLVIQKVQI